ncbi:hypothetical protein DAPPUDRAFT_94463 [Daphnia pulex]|uniref:Uncharacterized protein n=1 Tax=Daphnia pulex TaxID=6669 RepID=E9FRD8_DAPPU|nr:hypothetical protein DAPPUDRAFT_94463 [Daphnia pulex]|eukprot:EFX90146.1 hypothetical protein DAPPUDRAFT_94463 [Daphnia pulex]
MALLSLDVVVALLRLFLSLISETDQELTFRMDSIQFKSWARGNLRNWEMASDENKSTMANNKTLFLSLRHCDTSEKSHARALSVIQRHKLWLQIVEGKRWEKGGAATRTSNDLPAMRDDWWGQKLYDLLVCVVVSCCALNLRLHSEAGRVGAVLFIGPVVTTPIAHGS